MIVTKCDICGKEIPCDEPVRKVRAEWDRATYFSEVFTGDLAFGHNEKEYDLCSDCFRAMFDFMIKFKEDPFVKIVHIDEEVA